MARHTTDILLMAAIISLSSTCYAFADREVTHDLQRLVTEDQISAVYANGDESNLIIFLDHAGTITGAVIQDNARGMCFRGIRSQDLITGQGLQYTIASAASGALTLYPGDAVEIQIDLAQTTAYANTTETDMREAVRECSLFLQAQES